MREHGLLQSLAQTRQNLTSLRARLMHDGATPGSGEDGSVLAGLLETLEAMQAHCGRLHEILVRNGDAEVENHRLRSLASQIVIDEERLRQRLAADLQSGLGQDIALAKMEIEALRNSSSVDGQAVLERIERLVEQADSSLCSITYQICPPSLHDLGLVPALEWLAEDFSYRYRLDVRIEDAGIPALTDERVRIILFRAVRALLMNTATHAGATEVLVWLGPEDGSLRITVKDDGAGFDSAGFESAGFVGGMVGSEGYGLYGIREQVRHLGGSMRVDSVPGRGTTVELLAPLAMKTR